MHPPTARRERTPAQPTEPCGSNTNPEGTGGPMKDRMKGPPLVALVRRTAALFAVALALGALPALVRADDAAPPAPDPSGLATGDRTSVVDAGGTAFVVPEPAEGAPATDHDEFKAASEK